MRHNTISIFGKRLNEVSFGDEDTKVVFIDGEISTKDELMFLISRRLSFPDYFGMNWDALIDCLADLTWITQDNVVIIMNVRLPKELARSLEDVMRLVSSESSAGRMTKSLSILMAVD